MMFLYMLGAALIGAVVAVVFGIWYINRMDKALINNIERTMNQQIEEAGETMGQRVVVAMPRPQDSSGLPRFN